MLTTLNTKLKALIRNDEGFAIAMTILVWPLMLITVSGIFVTGETLRQKMILQNAADAAAHAGAMVQADTLSRVAVINRMMAWTYIQANKMEMDYTVINWANLTNQVLKDLKAPLKNANASASATCPHEAPHKTERLKDDIANYGWYAGTVTLNTYDSSKFHLNEHQTGAADLEGPTALRSNLTPQLSAAYGNINSMNMALSDLLNNCAERVESALKEVFAANSKEFAAKATLWFRRDNTNSYLVPMTRESAFLNLAGSAQSSSLVNAQGANWWTLDSSSEPGFRRAYTGIGLEARFEVGYKGWVPSGNTGDCVAVQNKSAFVYVQGSGTVHSEGLETPGLTSTDIYNKSQSFLGYNTNVRAVPRELTSGFLSRGAVLVGAKLPQTNPLAATFGDLTGSWFNAHTQSEATDIWCLSAARACAGTGSAYSRNKFENYSPGNTDYTAVMLPAAMAGNSAGDVAKEVYAGLNPQGWADLADWSLLNNFAARGE